MPVDRIDAQIQSLISGAAIETQKKVDQDDASDHARKTAEKKIAEKKENLKSTQSQREVYQRQSDVHGRMQQILGGAAGREAADALGNWQNNQQLQAKLTEAQKEMFREAMANNTGQASKAAQVLDRLSQQPGFNKAVNTAPQMGTLQAGVLENPKAEKPVADMLQSRFMQSAKSDAQAKNDFLRFGLRMANKGQMDAIKRAGDMLGTLTQNGVNKSGQRAAVNMANRKDADAKAAANVDAFMQNAHVGKMPTFVRSKATELLAKANGSGEVKEGFEQLAAEPKFKAQTAQNKGRFFSTIGTGRPSEFRELSDKSLQALRSSNFPKRAGQVGQFLGKMAAQVQKGGAKSVDPESLVKNARISALPTPPTLASAEGLDPEATTRVRSENRAKVIQFFNQLQRSYEHSEKKLNAAKYLEDVNSLQNLREPAAIDVTALPAEERVFVEERQQGVRETLERVRGLQRQRSRELRTKRMPPAKRRAMRAAQRLQGRQPKYFSPNAAGGVRAFQQVAAGAEGARPQPLPATPMRSQIQRSEAGIHSQVASAVAQLGQGPITPERATQVAQAIAQQVAQQVVAQVTEQLMGSATAPAAAPLVQEPSPAHHQSGKVDGWGIQRSFERDLGAPRPHVVKAAQSHDAAPVEPVEPYTGRTLVKDPTAVRPLGELTSAGWKSLTKAEVALLKNLGWSQQTWDTKDQPAARWPMSMATPFASLTPLQRESVSKLGFSAPDWDRRVQAFTMGKNA
ncbi:MAG: hypothetical protein HYZ27_02235 [Deltaproteobacteria bacterium]|nr:hypothetical protein [Deltaproteobacteria bacterium]